MVDTPKLSSPTTGRVAAMVLPCHVMGVTSSTAFEGPSAEEGCAGSDPLEAASVRAGWLLVDAYERLGARQARKSFGPSLDASIERARATLSDLRPWRPGLKTIKILESDTNKLRHLRTLDLVRDGETVFDVGFGQGYLCALLLRDRQISSYHGIDVIAGHRVAKLLQANGLTTDKVHLEVKDLYELERTAIEATGATLVTCCEVLEHLPDPQKALRVLANALPDRADLIFSVPLYGRLETVWGHCTTYDSARLKEMCAAAGLYVHHVEPVANTWTLVTASRHPEPSSRVKFSLTAHPLSLSVPLAEAYDFVAIEHSQITQIDRLGRSTCRLSPTRQGDTQCEVRWRRLAMLRPSGTYAGVAFPIRGLTSLRLRLGLPAVAPVSEIVVAAYSSSGHRLRWAWKPTTSDLREARTHVWAFRPGSGTSRFTYAGKWPTDKELRRVEILLRGSPSASASFTVGAAYVPSGAASRADQ
jgi:2-polyprenyl-3-methyl-5-hydroxy-6-metoxy-1,4-benzoquinol methylase